MPTISVLKLRCAHMKIVTVIAILGFSFVTFGQKQKPMNYRRFDEKLIHFGFMLGANVADYTLFPKTDAYETYGVKSITNQSTPGGQLGIVGTMKLGTPIVRMRLIPTLSFQERVINYEFVDESYTGDVFNVQRINSTSLDFPLMFQFRTLRLNNFAAYALIGGQYSLDLQSQEDADQDFNNPFIKMRKHDWQLQAGGGLEFFATYFKFGIELKYSHGLRNSFIQDNTPVSNPIDSFYNRGWWISIIFEG